jgi:hypothetical protein
LKCNTTTIVMKGGRDLLDNRRAGLKSGTFCNHIYQQYLERENTREKSKQTKANIRHVCGIESIYKLVIISFFFSLTPRKECSETIGKSVRYFFFFKLKSWGNLKHKK